MKRFVLSVIALLALYASPTFAEGGACAGCEAAGKAQERTVKGKGNPDPTAVCFYAVMSDPSDSVAVTISYGDKAQGQGEHIITFPRKAAQAMSGVPNRPMVCIPRQKLAGASQVLIIPGSKEGCTTLNIRDVQTLLDEKSIGKKHPVCLLKEAVCKQVAAKMPPGHYGRD